MHIHIYMCVSVCVCISKYIYIYISYFSVYKDSAVFGDCMSIAYAITYFYL